ncbi:Outer membrane protein OprM [Candidatus Magnetaquicoccaceae bacterium FCR-1]|uniref:Outer membrane protein OprM n=1 Tax=Candidatus Magnetaquiglobus chichijimensis TaxID=3141448 RepID=A0ABQ0CBJ3_9PROT
MKPIQGSLSRLASIHPRHRFAPPGARAGLLMALALLVINVSLTGCANRDATPPPLPDLPAAWSNPSAAPSAALPAAPWWQTFGNPRLDTLEEQALTSHPDIQAAKARLNQAEIRARMAESPLFPTLALSGSDQVSGQGRSGKSVRASQASLDASYELDYRGRNLSLIDKAQAESTASRMDREAVHWTLTADLASAYLRLLTLDHRRELARQSLEAAQRILEFTAKQVAFGQTAPLDETRQKQTVASIEAQNAALDLQRAQARDALALLANQPLSAIREIGGKLADWRIPEVPAGVPSDLLRRRPDIRRAEADLVASQADLAATRAALFPSLELTGERGYASKGLKELISPGNLLWKLGASLTVTLFDRGKQRDAIAVAEEARKAAVAAYQKAILAALKDVEDNLAAIHWLAEQEKAQQLAEDAAREALRLAEVRHRAGAVDFMNVLDAQRSLLQIQDELPQTRQARLNAAIGLFKALGGPIPNASTVALPKGDPRYGG